MSTREPTDDYLRERIGRWPTYAGTNPEAAEIVDAAEAILDGRESASEQLAKQTLQFVWRRLDYPHGSDWKRAEDRASRVLSAIRQGEVGQ